MLLFCIYDNLYLMCENSEFICGISRRVHCVLLLITSQPLLLSPFYSQIYTTHNHYIHIS
ncbi:hypothetical protein MACK_003619 [Theileria orientalis]|uniref:Uncharacterized protein n=1 Tax=Theileria orientalis TaxID=68886 RepID=A0A976XJE6_THEOR|nr:hypothetical protein MACK_003619 [Theileria orientalis]